MEIKNRDDFLVFFKEFITEIHTEDFENNTLDSFLEAMKNWIEDMDGYYKRWIVKYIATNKKLILEISCKM